MTVNQEMADATERARAILAERLAKVMVVRKANR